MLSDPEKRRCMTSTATPAFEGGGPDGPRSRARSGRPARRSPAPAGSRTSTSASSSARALGPCPTGGDEDTAGGGIFEDLIGRIRGGRAAPSGSRRPGGAVATEADLTIPFLTAIRGGTTTIEIHRAGGHPRSSTSRSRPAPTRATASGSGARGPRPCAGAQAGDLTIRVTVAPHPYFRREGRDLFVEVPITVGEAILGARVDVPTLDGLKTLHDSPRARPRGQKLRLRGQGVPAHGGRPAGRPLRSAPDRRPPHSGRREPPPDRAVRRRGTPPAPRRPLVPGGVTSRSWATPIIFPRDSSPSTWPVPPRLLLAYEARGLVRAVSRRRGRGL